MAALSNVHAASLLNTSLRSGTYYLALFLTDPTAAATGTEASGGGGELQLLGPALEVLPGLPDLLHRGLIAEGDEHGGGGLRRYHGGYWHSLLLGCL